MSSPSTLSKINSLAEEIVNSRDIEIADKLLKIREIALYNDDAKRTKHDIYKYGLLEALAVAFKNEYGFVRDGWSKAVELAKTFW